MKTRKAKKGNYNRKTRRYGLTGGNSKKIGEGDIGIVFRPPIQCDTIPNELLSDKYVSKIISEDDVFNELRGAELIKEIPNTSNYVALPVHTCRPIITNSLIKKFDTHELTNASSFISVIYPYVGVDLSDYVWTMKENKVVLFHLINLLFQLGEFIYSMNEYGVYHLDIGLNNITYNKDTDSCFLIDLEKVRTFDDFYSERIARKKYSKNISKKSKEEEFIRAKKYDITSLLRTIESILRIMGYKNKINVTEFMYSVDWNNVPSAMNNIHTMIKELYDN